MYKPMKTEHCRKCGKATAEPKELIRIVKEKKESDYSSDLVCIVISAK